MRALGMDPVRDARETFRALVDATSRPGTVRRVPVAPADRAVLATLVDHEVTCFTPDADVREALAGEGRLADAPFEAARVVHAPESTDGRVRDANRGTRKEPSVGATVIYRVDAVRTVDDENRGSGRDARDAPPIRSADSTRVTVTGPGVPDERTLAVGGLPRAELRAVADAQSDYPRGVDVVFAAGDRVAALPRSVSLEVA
ncbi:phosphonate C-P lyase system protein PhnH [Halegenticoccus tardaugens]|uniref:phosphonate C-P lyase system protein PhnH n=1 Tax=Halegenticoccus tardaugens TaxID=2071624 RepID=UPI00100B667D|nr:phosphonate C-P lyase system protein PhnH [Halegenticoccus tardaugens]